MDNVSVFRLPPEFPFCCCLFTAVLSRVLAGWSSADKRNREKKILSFNLCQNVYSLDTELMLFHNI